MRISDWSSDVCSSDLGAKLGGRGKQEADVCPRSGNRGACQLDCLRKSPAFMARPNTAQGKCWCFLDIPVASRSRSEASSIAGELLRHGRSEALRVGEEWVSTCSSRWCQYN